MIELLQITNDPALAARCDAMPGLRIFMDLERNGKAERQAGRNTFISAHVMADIAPVRQVLRHTRLMVRVNPLHEGTAAEVQAVLDAGADLLMLPMFRTPAELLAFSSVLAGRRPFVALLETRDALQSIGQWIATPGLQEVMVGLNDLHLSLGCRFMFEPLSQGHVETVASAAKQQGLRFGFGGIARLDEGLLPGRDVLAEHVRLGSRAVILSRTFHGAGPALHGDTFEQQIAGLRAAEAALARRDPAAMEADRLRIHGLINKLASAMPAPAGAA